MSGGKNRRVLGIIATDSTFERVEYRGREVWLGKCLHCNAKLLVSLEGEPISRATIEHIVPQACGGTNELENLGLACARCNQHKGITHDPHYETDPRAREVVDKLLERRRRRWRIPDAG